VNSAAVPRDPGDPAIDRRILAEAADWLTRMHDGPLDANGQAEFERWLSGGSEQRRAWKRADRLLARMEGLPPALTRSALGRPERAARRSLPTADAADAAVQSSGKRR
jgi:transmembrane sensor